MYPALLPLPERNGEQSITERNGEYIRLTL